MTYFLLLGTNQFAVVTDNRARCCDNRKGNILTFIAIKTGAPKSFFTGSGKQMVIMPLQINAKKY